MENEQNNQQKNDPKDQARNLYFQTGLTQTQIAELVGVSQKTISTWMNDGKWKTLKQTIERAPAVMVEHMISELAEINKNIAAREPGKRFPTSQEVDIRRKILASVAMMQEHQSKSANAEVITNFIHYVRKRSDKDVKLIIPYADKYLQGEVKLDQDPFIPYTLPGQPEPPENPDATSTPPGGGVPVTPLPSGSKVAPAAMSVAA